MRLFKKNLFKTIKSSLKDNPTLVEKLIHIFKTTKYYKIVTCYRCESWSYISGEPIWLLPLTTPLEELAEKIFEGLSISRSISETEEDKIWLGKDLLKKLKERSFRGLYRDSTSCSVSLDQEQIIIVPFQFMGGNQGLSEDEQRMITLNIQECKTEVTKKIITLLND